MPLFVSSEQWNAHMPETYEEISPLCFNSYKQRLKRMKEELSEPFREAKDAQFKVSSNVFPS
jgi:hypothetical protein